MWPWRIYYPAQSVAGWSESPDLVVVELAALEPLPFGLLLHCFFKPIIVIAAGAGRAAIKEPVMDGVRDFFFDAMFKILLAFLEMMLLVVNMLRHLMVAVLAPNPFTLIR